MKQTVKKLLLPLVRPFWHRMWLRIEGRISPIESRMKPIESRIEGIEGAWRAHIPSFLNAMASVPAISHEFVALAKRLDELAQVQFKRAEATEACLAATEVRGKNVDASIASLWERIEFVRREILFEFSHRPGPAMMRGDSQNGKMESRIISFNKYQTALAQRNLRLNLGCGHIALPDYINVDVRDLPGVDVLADIGELPFEEHSVEEIYSAHLIEHFPLETMRRSLLPHWRSRLRPGGKFRAVTPDAGAMVQAAASGTMSFEDFREVTFGAQDYHGDYHFNLFTQETLQELLWKAGFRDISIPFAGRRSGKCFEFEIAATAP